MPNQNPNLPGTRPDGFENSAMGCGWGWLWFCLFIIVIFFAGWGWTGWSRGWGAPYGGWWEARQVSPGSGPSISASGSSQQNAPPSPAAAGEFLGKTVTLSGQVDQVFDARAFALAGSEGGHRLLVVSKSAKAPTLKKGETVQITGTVEKYDAAQTHTTTGADLSKVPSANFEGRPVLLASSVSAKEPG